MRQIDTATRLCAVIGNPVEHSLSPLIHNAAFEATGLNYVYVAFHVEDVAGCLTGMRALPSFRGMSVTIPHKRAVMDYLDEIEPMAQHVGSVNTITNYEGRLIGATTDGPGTLRAFADADVDLRGKRVLFVGSGGAVRAVAFAMAELAHVSEITILGRTESKVTALVDDLQSKTECEVRGRRLEQDLPSAMASHDIVIQGTSVGMHPHPGETCVPRELFRAGQVAFDMVYRPSRTRFIQDAEAAGCQTIPGVEMLINQAVLQFERWTGVPAPRNIMRDALVAELVKAVP
ncbi:MAG: shikimate dehydrogenase [Candidatus Hydrogenedentes bacterium]|nr:shikimate dehydrogenase [Candidatus Hydrogenedentota bacterium]